MASIIIKGRRYTQPQIVDRIASEWKDRFIGGWYAGQPIIVEPGGAILLATDISTQGILQNGIGSKVSSYASTQLIQLPDSYRLIGEEFSFVCGITLNSSLTLNTFQAVFSVRNSSVQYASFLIGNDGGASWIGGRWAFNVGSDTIGTYGSARTNRFAVYGADVTSSGRNLYVDGLLDTTSGTTTLIASNTVTPVLLNRSTGGRGFHDGYVHFAYFTKPLTADEHKALNENPWQVFEQPQRRIWVPMASGGATLTPSLFTNTNTFYSPTVGRGAVTLTPALFTSATNAFYSATITQGGATQTLTPSLFSNSQSFYSATVTPGGVSLAPSLLTNGQTFYAPTVTPGSVTLAPSLFTNSNTFYGPVVTQEGGPQYLTVPLVSNTNEFYAPTVTPGAITVTPDLFANAQTFYAATVSQGAPGQTLEPELFVSTNQFFTAIVTVGGVTLTPSLFTNSNTFYAHLLTGGDTVNALMSAPRTGTYRNTSSATRSNLQTARRPKA